MRGSQLGAYNNLHPSRNSVPASTGRIALSGINADILLPTRTPGIEPASRLYPRGADEVDGAGCNGIARAVFAYGAQHAQILKFAISLSPDVPAPGFQFLGMVHDLCLCALLPVQRGLMQSALLLLRRLPPPSPGANVFILLHGSRARRTTNAVGLRRRNLTPARCEPARTSRPKA